MRNAILQKFIIIVLVALGLSSVFYYVMISRLLSDTTHKDMAYALRLVDYGMDYSGELQPQLERLNAVTLTNDSRLTILERDGTVIVDTSIDNVEPLENHLDREEVEAAIQYGAGYSKRYSETLQTTMLYVSRTSEYSDYIIRLAIPYSGSFQYLQLLLPAVFISFFFALVVAVFLSVGVSNSITKPLKEIAEEMHKLQHRNPQFHFSKYKYEELNTIAETTTKMSETINNTMERLEHEKTIRQEFFSNVSHELKTPITSIQGYTELLETNIITNEEMKQDFLKRIKKETRNMTNLINDILMISRLETKQAEEQRTKMRVKPMLDEVLDSLAPLAAELTVNISIDCRPLMIVADPKHIQQLLNNLITNAIKYNNPGGKVTVLITEEGKNMLLRVSDNGVGIPEESVGRVFERFYRVDKGRSKKMGGTGLGLAIVKHIVQFYQGTIDLKSVVDQGTVITIRLPVLEEDS